MASVVLKGMYARRMFTQYCYDRVVFFYRRPFFIFSSPLLPISFTVKTYARDAICYSFFFFYPWGGKTEGNRDKDQRENERHKRPSLSENVPFSNWKKKSTLFTEQRITRLKQRISIYLNFRWDWGKVNLNRMRNL